MVSGFRDSGFGFQDSTVKKSQPERRTCRSQPSCFRVRGSEFMVQGSGFRVQGSRFRVQGSGFRVQGSGFRIDFYRGTSLIRKLIPLGHYRRPTPRILRGS